MAQRSLQIPVRERRCINSLTARAFFILLVVVVQLPCAGVVQAEKAGSGRADAPASALSLARQARQLAAQGKYARAIDLTQRALPMARREYGEDHMYIAYLLDDLATYRLETSNLQEALQLSTDALQIAGRRLERDSPDYAALVSNRASILSALGRYRQAEALYLQAYAVFRPQSGKASERTVRTARNLGIAYLELSRYDEAERYLTQAAETGKKIYGESDSALGRIYLDFADVKLAREDLPGARQAADEARRIFTAQSSPDIEDVVSAEITLAKADIQQSMLNEADTRLQAARDQLERAGRQESLVAASVLYNRGFIMVLRGNAVEAEPVYKRVLLLYRKAVGPEHPAVGRAQHSLALVYSDLGEYRAAERLFVSAIDNFTRNFGSVDASVAASRTELSLLLTEMKRPVDAIAEARVALAVYAKLPGSSDIKRAYAMSALGFALHEHGDLDEAKQRFIGATALMAQVRGNHSSDLPPGLTQLGEIYWKQGSLDDAERTLQRAIAILEKDRALTGHGLANSLSVLAKVRLSQRRYRDALDVARRYVSVIGDRLDVAQRSYSAAALGEQRKSRYLYEDYLDIAQTVAGREAASRDGLVQEMFTVAQYPHLTDTAAAISRMAARFIPDEAALGELVRRRQKALEQWRAVNALLTEKLTAQTSDRREQAGLKARLLKLEKELAALDERLRREFPGYAELVNPRPVQASDVRPLLAADEALLVQVTGENGTHVFLARPDRLLVRNTSMTAAELETAVRDLREGLDIQHHRFDDLPPFDTQAAYFLYNRLIEPFAGELGGVSHIILVADGAMQNLPPSVLLASPAGRQPGSTEDFRHLDFLGRRFAFSISPSVSAFRTLRINADSRHVRQPFVGFGDPKLAGAAGSDTRGLGFDIVAQSVTEVDPKGLQGKMAALPESSQELHAMAKLLGAGDNTVYLGARASEALVKRTNLAAYRTVAFATHALMTGEFRGLAEPALVMTPPAKSSDEDDGLLTASEVAQLKLDADWVVLSACNTASPAGKPGAEGLSGLAKAFFYAGSRSLLVSHWWVVSDSTVLLTTGAVEALRNNPSMRRAEALQNAMLGLMDGKADPNYAHPVFWAPFVLVGEGGPMRLD